MRAPRSLGGVTAMLLLGAVSIAAGAAAQSELPDVIPMPADAVPQPGAFALRAGVVVAIAKNPELARIAEYFAGLLQASHGVRLKGVSGGDDRARDGGIRFALDPGAPGASPESYRLEGSSRGIEVAAREPRGLFYGAVTLWQLASALQLHDGALTLSAVRIEDTPRFRWRGLMLDSARHFQSPEFILRYLDWMALHKLNVLGWHLTDDQGWRLEIKRYPRLTAVGAWRVPAGGRAPQRAA